MKKKTKDKPHYVDNKKVFTSNDRLDETGP